MTEQLGLAYAANRARQLGYGSFDVRPRTLGLEIREKQHHTVVDGLWLLVEADPGIRVGSDAGEWDKRNSALRELSHEHSGQITVENKGTERAFVTVLQITWLDEPVGLPV